MSADNPGIRVPPPLIALALVLAGLALDGRFQIPDVSWHWRQVVGTAMCGAGLLSITAALTSFGVHHTRAEPWRGASELVTDGIYRVTRNPMYVGLVVVQAGIALFFTSVSTAVLAFALVVAINRFIIPREEAYLTRRFGAAYSDYLERVPRWM